MSPSTFQGSWRVLRVLVAFSLTVFCWSSGSPARAAIYTVGPHGSHSNLAAALAAAAADPALAEVRIEAATYVTFGLETAVGVGQRLALIGGWDAAFAQRNEDPAATVLDADRLGRVLAVDIDRGELRLVGITFRNALVSDLQSLDAAVAVENKNGSVAVERCVFADNLRQSDGSSSLIGAALSLYSPSSDGAYRVQDSVFRNNRVESIAGDAGAAGLYLFNGGGKIEVVGNRFENNVTQSPGLTSYSAGVIGTSRGTVTFNDNLATGNQVVGTSAPIWGAITLIAFDSGGRIVARRNQFVANRSSTGEGAQLSVSLLHTNASALIGDTLVAASPKGVGLNVASRGVARLVNVTVVDNRGGNLALKNTAGTLSLANSLVFGGPGPQTHFEGTITQVKNLIGTDPLFVSRAARNYRLRASSPARDHGTSTPPGKLGATDLDRTARVKGIKVDLGAYESF